MRILRKKFLVLLAALTVAGIVAAIAIPAVISNQIISDGTGTLHYRFQKIIADGRDSGWHIHPGLVVVQVEEGSFQIYQGSCIPRTVGPGDTYIEVPYKPVRAIAKGRIVFTVSLLTNAGDPVEIPQPGYDPCPGIG
jgi:hypothetical protein